MFFTLYASVKQTMNLVKLFFSLFPSPFYNAKIDIQKVCLGKEKFMDFKHLHYFITVVQEGTISAAARKLHISQPPLSIAIKQLEEELQTTLFHRGSRHIILTESGKILYQKASMILDLCNQTTQSIQDISKGIGGTLKLGIASSLQNMFLEIYMKKFHFLYPDMKFELTESDTYHLLEMLESHTIEAAIVRTPFPTAGFERIHLSSEPMTAVGHPEFFNNLPSGSLKLSALTDAPFIIYRRWQSLLLHEFKKYGIKPDILCVNDDARTTIEWAVHGLGVGIVPKSAVHAVHCTNFEIRPIDCKELSSDIVCIFASKQHRCAAMEYFYEYMKQHTFSN